MDFQIRYKLSDSLKILIAGEFETVFQLLESRFCVKIQSREHDFLSISGRDASKKEQLLILLDKLKIAAKKNISITPELVSSLLGNPKEHFQKDLAFEPEIIIRNKFGMPVIPKTKSQALLVQESLKNDILFVNGPAGSGKTFLAVALAVAALEKKEVERICLVRPAVEAGESLGFLPGDLKEKIAPYLQPIQDVLQELLPKEKLSRYEESFAIEIAPLAYMRGRTLKYAFIILDEAQNATIPQMKMFLTRLGERSKVIITGDSSQVDLARKEPSGFTHAMQILKGIRGVSSVQFHSEDVIRHALVKDIILAYEQFS